MWDEGNMIRMTLTNTNLICILECELVECYATVQLEVLNTSMDGFFGLFFCTIMSIEYNL